MLMALLGSDRTHTGHVQAGVSAGDVDDTGTCVGLYTAVQLDITRSQTNSGGGDSAANRECIDISGTEIDACWCMTLATSRFAAVVESSNEVAAELLPRLTVLLAVSVMSTLPGPER